MDIVLKIVFSCETLGLEDSFQRTCFGHVFFNICQYVATNETFYTSFKYVFISFTQIDLQNYITWPKNLTRAIKMELGLVLIVAYAQEN
jgi:hypothetical protein